MKKQLSALVDGELEVDGSAHVISAMKSNEQVKNAWKHYHLIGDAMRGDADMQPDFSARVIQALEESPRCWQLTSRAKIKRSQNAL